MAVETKDAKFVSVKCPDCNNRQIVFLKASTKIQCQACGSTLAVPKGGNCDIKGEIVEVVE